MELVFYIGISTILAIEVIWYIHTARKYKRLNREEDGKLEKSYEVARELIEYLRD